MTIKRSPEDFQVEELLSDEAAQRITPERRSFALYRLVKKSLTTPDALAAISKTLKTPVASMSYSGLKDRYASTMQHISIAESSAGNGDGLPARAADKLWSIDRIGWCDAELNAACITGNRFVIMVRGLTRRDLDDMNDAAKLLCVGADLTSGQSGAIRIVNYFGDQRFGSARHGQGFMAPHLIRGDFETALKLAIGTVSRQDRGTQQKARQVISRQWGKWKPMLKALPKTPERRVVEHLAAEPTDFMGAFTKLPYFTRQMAVEAYQSHLWNAIARDFVQQNCGQPGQVIEADDPYGVMVFPSAANIVPELIDLNVPLLSRRTALLEPWKESVETVLAGEELELRDLRIPGMDKPFFGEAPRRLFVDATEFSLGDPQKDETDSSGRQFRRRVVMTLPRGAYATVVLRALGQ